ncbi:MAG: DJ-1/PfpI family protein [Chromatiales bacterium]|nr:DJ-1/PfpI family protein [Chromatiales bacterium]
MRIAILTYPGLTALDAIGPFEVFNILREFEICFVWKEVGPVVADGGRLILGATHTLDEVQCCDLLLVPGSSANTLTVMADDVVMRWLRAVHAGTRFTASVCSGALILAAAGLLGDEPATTHWAAMPLLPRYGAKPEPDKRIVESGKLVTAAGVSAGIDLALHLVAKLLDPERAKIAQLLIEYDPQPPFDSGHMRKAQADIARKAKARMSRIAMTNPRNLISIPKLLTRQWRT